MIGGEALCCPVCRARFRDSRTCSRCGADLAPLMALGSRAFALRQAAAEALRGGKFARAHELAGQAHALCATPRGTRLLTVTSLLVRLQQPQRSATSAGTPGRGIEGANQDMLLLRKDPQWPCDSGRKDA